MKTYLAARYDRRKEMLKVATKLRELGHSITSRWINGSHTVASALCAEEDLEDIRNSDTLILFTDQPGSGGRHVEFGYALALGLNIYVVGNRFPENIFQLLRVIHCCRPVDLFHKLTT